MKILAQGININEITHALNSPQKGSECDKIYGCLFGGAVGDALGYPVEFQSMMGIYGTYGKKGIQLRDIEKIAIVSDDTQMSLFTTAGLITAFDQKEQKCSQYYWVDNVWNAYLDWLYTQDQHCKPQKSRGWLADMKEMQVQRAPGNTCLDMLYQECKGSTSCPYNTSKGCGGIMRIAPVGIAFVDKIGGDIAALTHGHPLGYIPAAAMTHIISRLISSDMTLEEIVEEAVNQVSEIYKGSKYIGSFQAIIRKAVTLSKSFVPCEMAIKQIGEGWVAEETLAIAVYCSLRYKNDFVKAVTAAVNYDGDSDSTGAVTGNIMGALVGLNGIPKKPVEALDLNEIISTISYQIFQRINAK